MPDTSRLTGQMLIAGYRSTTSEQRAQPLGTSRPTSRPSALLRPLKDVVPQREWTTDGLVEDVNG